MRRRTSSRKHGNLDFGENVSFQDPTAVFAKLDKIGEGSYGSVFKGVLRSTQQAAALKVITIVSATNAALGNIKKEIAILKECRHPNIVRYFGSYVTVDMRELWIAMEYCGGGSVEDVLRNLKRPFLEQHIALVCREALKGLEYLSSLKKIHRDVKGANILLTENAAIKLADFGVAAQLSATLPQRHTLIGTPYWMAPEVIQDSTHDGRADVWSLGITAIEMAEMLPPNASVPPMRVLFMIPSSPPPTLSNATQSSPEFVDFVSQCLTKQVEYRPTAKQLLEHPFVRHLPKRARMPPAFVSLVTESMAIEDSRKQDAAAGIKDIIFKLAKKTEDAPLQQEMGTAQSSQLVSEISSGSGTWHRSSTSQDVSLPDVEVGPVPNNLDMPTHDTTQDLEEMDASKRAALLEERLAYYLSIQERLLDENDALKARLAESHQEKTANASQVDQTEMADFVESLVREKDAAHAERATAAARAGRAEAHARHLEDQLAELHVAHDEARRAKLDAEKVAERACREVEMLNAKVTLLTSQLDAAESLLRAEDGHAWADSPLSKEAQKKGELVTKWLQGTMMEMTKSMAQVVEIAQSTSVRQ